MSVMTHQQAAMHNRFLNLNVQLIVAMEKVYNHVYGNVQVISTTSAT